ncbi:MAG TPA: citramalate synthase [Planctomycetia bacterium]|nr:citramalate synthase [Planctomycetia bacterium]
MPRIDIYDTTLRDGSQGEGVNFSLQDKLLLTARLDEFGIDFIEGGYPLSNPKDAAYFQEARSLKLRHAKVAAFGMTRRRGVSAAEDVGLRALVDAETSVVTIVGKTWDLHVREVLRVDLEENLAMIADSVRFLVAAGRRVFYDAEHFFDGLAANRDYALATVRAAREAGAAAVILCDTNGGSLPERIAESTALAHRELGPVGIHCHNDADLATANSLAAVAAGATQVQGTVNGIGERCGNADLVPIVANLILKCGREALPDAGGLVHLGELSRYVYDIANMNYRPGQPYVGASAFAHKGGMHVHAVEKIPHSYEHVPPESVGASRRILVSEVAGQTAVLVAVSGRHQLSREDAQRVMARVQDLENEGYQFEAADASFDLLVRETLGKRKPLFERALYRVMTEESDGVPVTEATLKVWIADRLEHVVAEGDVPVNALDTALRKALDAVYPALREMSLVDYKVRVVNPKAGTAARVRVTVESRDADHFWGTVGVHENIIEASWRALVESFEYKVAIG